jgi:hypothetical protein
MTGKQATSQLQSSRGQSSEVGLASAVKRDGPPWVRWVQVTGAGGCGPADQERQQAWRALSLLERLRSGATPEVFAEPSNSGTSQGW